MEITPIDVLFSPSELFSLINSTPVSVSPDRLDNPLLVNLELQQVNIEDNGEQVVGSVGFNQLYLQYPNEKIRDFAYRQVGISPDDTNDVKVWKIANWVVRNIRYVTDDQNYGVEEFWAPPIFTLAKLSGDCEDGAFLIHSLALNVGVPASRLRTYGGYVRAGRGAETGGHGWTAYQRESDNQWVVIDFSYFPETGMPDSRTPMTEDDRYIDDYWFVDLYEWIATPNTNRVRHPEGYDNAGQLAGRLQVGFLVDLLV